MQTTSDGVYAIPQEHQGLCGMIGELVPVSAFVVEADRDRFDAGRLEHEVGIEGSPPMKRMVIARSTR